MNEHDPKIESRIDDKTANELIDKPKIELVKEIKNTTDVLADSSNDLIIVTQFKMGKKYWDTKKNLRKKEICFSFQPTLDEKSTWENDGIPKISSLLTYLKKKFGGYDKFVLIFFRQSKPKTFYFEPYGKVTNVYVNIDRYTGYSSILNPIINNLKISKYHRKILIEFAKKVPKAFFNNQPPSSLIDELKQSDYKVLEDIINEYENLPDDEKKDLKAIIEHSKLGDDAFNEITNSTPESPTIRLKLFLKVIDELGKKESEILLRGILKSKSSRYFIKTIGTLSPKDQTRMARNLPEMARMYERYEKLEDSLRSFSKLIKEHSESQQKNEKEIHRFLTTHYWLLGIEYFDRIINSDIDSEGNRTKDTLIGRKHADFIILQRLDGLDKCVVIELEEANDKIFNDDGTISKKVYDGIVQAIDYSLEQKIAKIYSKGIAVIGSLSMSKLSAKERRRLEILADSFTNVEVLTYDQIIKKAQSTLDFWKRYEHGLSRKT